MKKRILTVLTATAALCLAAGLSACIKLPPVYDDPQEVLSFTLNEDGKSYSVSAGEDKKKVKNVSIPQNHEGLPVTGIAEEGFLNCNLLENVQIPEGVTSVGQSAFNDCAKLSDISIPDSVTEIGASAFYKCRNLLSVKIPAGVQIIDNDVFGNCNSLAEVTVPDGLTHINENAFENCNSLTEIILPDGLTRVDNAAFRSCRSLEKIQLPDTVSFLGEYAFAECKSLESAVLGNGLEVIGERAFAYCSALTGITIPETVESIETSAFYGCTALKEATVPDGVHSIESFTFNGCSSLSSVTLGKDTSAIGSFAFGSCTSLTEIVLPDGVHEIGAQAFYNCTALSKIDVPERVIDIGVQAFKGTAYSNNEINWNDGVLYLGVHLIEAKPELTGDYAIKEGTVDIADYAFGNCGLLTGIRIPDSVILIHIYSFRHCNALEKITVDANNTYYRSEGNCLIHNDTLVLGCKSSVIPGGITHINYNAFSDCSVTEITIPDSVTTINDSAFYNCTQLTEITIGGNVKNFGNYVFTNCNNIERAFVTCETLGYIPCSNLKRLNITGGAKISARAMFQARKLTTLTLHGGITEIGADAFSGCTALSDIYFEGSKALWNSIQKGDRWDYGTGTYTVHCLDGDVTK